MPCPMAAIGRASWCNSRMCFHSKHWATASDVRELTITQYGTHDKNHYHLSMYTNRPRGDSR